MYHLLTVYVAVLETSIFLISIDISFKLWPSCFAKTIFCFLNMCWLLSAFGIARVCAKYDLLVSKILSFILNMRQVRTSTDENFIGFDCIWYSVGVCKKLSACFYNITFHFWTCDMSGWVQTSVCGRKR